MQYLFCFLDYELLFEAPNIAITFTSPTPPLPSPEHHTHLSLGVRNVCNCLLYFGIIPYTSLAEFGPCDGLQATML